MKKYTKESIQAYLEKIKENIGRYPTKMELSQKEDAPSYSSIRRFGLGLGKDLINKSKIIGHCLECNAPIGLGKKENKFCSKSCSAKYNNRKRKTAKFFLCLNCELPKEQKKNESKYCCVGCQVEHHMNQKVSEGTASARTLKKFLLKKYGNKCFECGIDGIWNGKPISMELEHKDGNSDNNDLSNLSLLCPNCHSQTPTYKSKNKGNGRHVRRMRYKKGVSF